MKKNHLDKIFLSIIIVFCCFYSNSNEITVPNISSQDQSFENKQKWFRTWLPQSQHSSVSASGYSVWGDDQFLYTCGYEYASDLFDFDPVIMKWDRKGQLYWIYSWNNVGYDYVYDICGDEHNLYVCGRTDSKMVDLLFIKLDKNGNEVWNKTWGNLGTQIGYELWVDNDFIYISGVTTEFDSTNEDILIMKWDKDGDIIWNSTWGGVDIDAGNAIWGDENYIYVGGFTKSSGSGNGDAIILKWDKDGNLIWNFTWGGIESEEITGIIGKQNDIFVCGMSKSFGIGNTDIFLINIDYQGNIIWNKSWGTLEEDISDDIWLIDDKVNVCGSSKGFSLDHFDPDLITWNIQGEFQYIYAWRSDFEGFARSIWGDDKNLYICGELSYSFTLLKLEIVTNFFLLIGIPIISFFFVVVILGVTIKPFKRIKRMKLKNMLISLLSEINHSNDYFYILKVLEEKFFPICHMINDNLLLQKGVKLQDKSLQNIDFYMEFVRINDLISDEKFEKAYGQLISLLKKTHLPKYDMTIDKNLVSDITDALKSVSSKIQDLNER